VLLAVFETVLGTIRIPITIPVESKRKSEIRDRMQRENILVFIVCEKGFTGLSID
jgi:hypothetical protein